MTELKVRITFIEEVLGTTPNKEQIYREFVGTKAPNPSTIEEEVLMLGVDGVAEKGTTIFPKDENGKPFLWDYQIKGFFKDACSMLSRLTIKDENGKKKAVNESSKIKAYKKVIDGLIFVKPRQIFFNFDGIIRKCERPLRAQTQQGEHNALASSEMINADAYIDCIIVCLESKNIKAVKEWLDYGSLRGIGQWRNSGKGRFTWKEIK